MPVPNIRPELRRSALDERAAALVVLFGDDGLQGDAGRGGFGDGVGVGGALVVDVRGDGGGAFGAGEEG